MTLFEIIVPIVAVVVALVGFLVLRAQGRALDRRSKE
jgi:hypothetical protein